MIEIPVELIAQASTAYDAVQMIDDTVFCIESRPDGRDVLTEWTPRHGVRDVTPADMNIASYVHEYGGGAYLATDTAIWFCNAADQRLYRLERGRAPDPMTAGSEPPLSLRYADLRLTHDRSLLIGVRERHEAHDVINELVAIPADGNGREQTITSGWDFYSFPRPGPDGRWLAWICWNAPYMPWDATWLFVAELNADGRLGEPIPVAGGPHESVFQPEWSHDGVLHFISDRSGWWNLYAWKDGKVSSVLLRDADMGVAQWEFGYSTYAFLSRGRIAILMQRGGQQELHVIEDGDAHPIELPHTSIKPYLSASGSTVAIIASSPTRLPAVVLADVDSGTTRRLTKPTGDDADLLISIPEPFAFDARDGERVYGLYYRPSKITDSKPPPLIVKAHPGPTANAQVRLDWHTQYFTSRGYAVAEVDYRGSTGYGRAYRQALQGRWGILDAFDCADAATHLAAAGKANSQRIAIWGASAGGYTALRALALTDVFSAGIVRSPVVAPETWRKVTPKFQAHHVDGLIGPWLSNINLYKKRSVFGDGKISEPVLILHGEKDQITPASESRALAQRLGESTELIIFPNEGHTLRSAKAIAIAIETETHFLTAKLSL